MAWTIAVARRGQQRGLVKTFQVFNVATARSPRARIRARERLMSLLKEAALTSGDITGEAFSSVRFDDRWPLDALGRVRECRRQGAGSRRSAGSTPAERERRAN